MRLHGGDEVRVLGDFHLPQQLQVGRTYLLYRRAGAAAHVDEPVGPKQAEDGSSRAAGFHRREVGPHRRELFL